MTEVDLADGKVTHTRQLHAPDGSAWVAYAAAAIVAHGKTGAALAFRLVEDDGAESLTAKVTFNSMAAADLALRTMADKELQRRLSLARHAAGGL